MKWTEKERKEFEIAHQSGVLAHSSEDVSAFLDDYLSDVEVEDISIKHECYTTVIDAIIVWERAMKFAISKLQTSMSNEEAEGYINGESEAELAKNMGTYAT